MSETPGQRLPTTLVEAIRYFEDPDVCNDFVAQLRWPDGPVCPRCEGTEHSYLTTRRLWKCKSCKRQFSVKQGTIFEDSPIKLKNWLASIWLIANSKNGISSYELARAIGLSQKSAWFVLHRIRLAMRTGSFDKFDGEVEVDETFVGGMGENMHSHRRPGRGFPKHHSMVVGSLQRGRDGQPSQVRAEVQLSPEWQSPRSHVRENVEEGADLYTDGSITYLPLRGDYKHQFVDHSAGEYVRGRVGTNGIENFWALLKRGLHGTYVAVDPEHLFRYVDERAFTFNERDLTDLGRFSLVLQRVAGRRLTWNALTGNELRPI